MKPRYVVTNAPHGSVCVCTDCGAYVAYTKTHDEWHARLEEEKVGR